MKAMREYNLAFISVVHHLAIRLTKPAMCIFCLNGDATLKAISAAVHRAHIDKCVIRNCARRRQRKGQKHRLNLQECVLHERAQPGEGLSRQLDPDFSHAGQTVALNVANREGAGAHHTKGQQHANGVINRNGFSSAHCLSRVKDAQHQQPSMQAGEHVLLSYKYTCLNTYIRSSAFHDVNILFVLMLCLAGTSTLSLVTSDKTTCCKPMAASLNECLCCTCQ